MCNVRVNVLCVNRLQKGNLRFEHFILITAFTHAHTYTHIHTHTHTHTYTHTHLSHTHTPTHTHTCRWYVVSLVTLVAVQEPTSMHDTEKEWALSSSTTCTAVAWSPTSQTVLTTVTLYTTVVTMRMLEYTVNVRVWEGGEGLP